MLRTAGVLAIASKTVFSVGMLASRVGVERSVADVGGQKTHLKEPRWIANVCVSL